MQVISFDAFDAPDTDDHGSKSLLFLFYLCNLGNHDINNYKLYHLLNFTLHSTANALYKHLF